MGTEFSPQQDLLEGVAEANWLLRKIWQSVEGVRNQTRRMAVEAERAEVRRELEGLQEEADEHCDESSEDSDSSGLWRMELEETEESEGSELEVEKEMDKEAVDEEMTL